MVAACLAGIAGLAWLWLADMALRPASMAKLMEASVALGGGAVWTAADVALMLAMWLIMMAGMMLPSAAPMILVHAQITRQRRNAAKPFAATGVFALGYLAAWGCFSVAATLLQWGLQRAALLSPMLVSNSATLGGLLLVAAGLYQWTPLKRACLAKCRSPLHFLLFRWRGGSGGALRMGLEHGLYCLGCCWILMALLFVGGVMNLAWIAAVAAFVLLEKVAPGGPWIGRVAGGGLILWGGAILLPLAA